MFDIKSLDISLNTNNISLYCPISPLLFSGLVRYSMGALPPGWSGAPLHPDSMSTDIPNPNRRRAASESGARGGKHTPAPARKSHSPTLALGADKRRSPRNNSPLSSPKSLTSKSLPGSETLLSPTASPINLLGMTKTNSTVSSNSSPTAKFFPDVSLSSDTKEHTNKTGDDESSEDIVIDVQKFKEGPSPSDDLTNETQRLKPAKSRCPCLTSSNGKSWLLSCHSCGQIWHNHCANLKGDKLTQEALDSILKHWQCPWCFVVPFPCPKGHKAEKTKLSLDSITNANEFLTTVVGSLETMVDTKLSEVLRVNAETVEAIGKQLESLSSEISNFKNSSNPSNITPLISQVPIPTHQFPPQPPVSQIEVENSPISHNLSHIEDFVENFITAEEEEEVITLLNNESFVNEGNRGVVQYGEHYKYMGSKTKPKTFPEPIKKIMDALNQSISEKHRDKRFHYTLNSCLVNKYQGNSSTLPEHSDDEGDICPWSSIFTVSVGSTRTVVFRDKVNNQETPLHCAGRSMYEMSRISQNFIKHQIKAQPEVENSPQVRYSLTFRAVHWANFNSTILIGDSNFGKIQFGVGAGKIGQATPGLRTFAATVDDIEPLSCSPFRNIVVMVGTNNLKNDMTDPEIRDLYKSYKLKIIQMRHLNPKAKILVCPVLPTKSSVINKRIFKFNNYICNDLMQSDLKILFVEGFIDFLDKQSHLLRNDLAVGDANDILHINHTKGVRLLVKLIKQTIFNAKKSKTVDMRTYANVTRGGPANPI